MSIYDIPSSPWVDNSLPQEYYINHANDALAQIGQPLLEVTSSPVAKHEQCTQTKEWQTQTRGYLMRTLLGIANYFRP